MFCIVLPSSCALFCPVLLSIVENEKPIAVFLSVAILQSTWFSPDFLWWVCSFSSKSSNPKTIVAPRSIASRLAVQMLGAPDCFAFEMFFGSMKNAFIVGMSVFFS